MEFLPELSKKFEARPGASTSVGAPIDLIREFAVLQTMTEKECAFFLKVLGNPRNDLTTTLSCSGTIDNFKVIVMESLQRRPQCP